MAVDTPVSRSSTGVLPRHSKLWLLDLGTLEADAGWFFAGANTSTSSQLNPSSERRTLKMLGALIEHPKHGLLMYEVGPVHNPPERWGEHLHDVFTTTTTPENRLDRAINGCGHDIKDVKGVIIGHLHLDHAGGLDYFRGTDVPIFVHEKELATAFLAVASKRDYGPYLPDYLTFDLNWQLLAGSTVPLFPGITLYHTPGHTPGLMGMLLDLRDSGPFYFSTDQFIFREHYENGSPQGWLMRDYDAWHRSLAFIRQLERTTGSTMVFGHDPEVFSRIGPAGTCFE